MAELSYPITRSCLRNLKYQRICKIVTFTQEDEYGYYGCGYILTDLARLKAHIDDHLSDNHSS